eukprot:Platyproteum_vivax@DN7881_c0_g1_i1.p1
MRSATSGVLTETDRAKMRADAPPFTMPALKRSNSLIESNGNDDKAETPDEQAVNEVVKGLKDLSVWGAGSSSAAGDSEKKKDPKGAPHEAKKDPAVSNKDPVLPTTEEEEDPPSSPSIESKTEKPPEPDKLIAPKLNAKAPEFHPTSLVNANAGSLYSQPYLPDNMVMSPMGIMPPPMDQVMMSPYFKPPLAPMA